MAKFFCRKFDLEKGVTFLFFMDILGFILYSLSIIGTIYAFEGGVEGFYLSAALDLPIYKDLNTIVLAHSSLIIACSTIPRLFTFCFVRGNKQDIHRRTAYFWIRVVTCVSLICLQLTIFIALIYYLVQVLTDPEMLGTVEATNKALNKTIIPLIVVYGIALFTTLGVDPYWTMQMMHLEQEGRSKEATFIQNQQKSFGESHETRVIRSEHTEQKHPINSVAPRTSHVKTPSMVSLTTTQDGSVFKQAGNEVLAGQYAPSQNQHSGVNSAAIASPKTDHGSALGVKDFEKQSWDTSQSRNAQQLASGSHHQTASTSATISDQQVLTVPSQKPPKYVRTSIHSSGQKLVEEPPKQAAPKIISPVNDDRAPAGPVDATTKPTTTAGAQIASSGRTLTPEQTAFEQSLNKSVTDIWRHFDKDKNGVLGRREARDFVRKTLLDLQAGERFSEVKFAELFSEFDANKSGSLSKKEMKMLLRKIAA